MARPERIYIGSTMYVARRWHEHEYGIKNRRHYNLKLQRHCNKYGWEDMVFEIIVQCDRSVLIKTEQMFIDLYKPYFNICPKAGSCFGRSVSDETKRKVSEALAGRKRKPLSEDHKKKVSEGLKRRPPYSEETRQKLSKVNKGKKWSPEIIERMREGCKHRKPITEEAKEKMRRAKIGKRRSDEIKKRMSEAQRLRWAREKAA